jgi:cell division protein FtsN
MIKRTTGFLVLIFLFALYTGCNSAIYEIVEVEEPIEEIKEEVKPPVTEIKEDTKPPENKFSEKNVVSRTYVVQIGAFTDEENAERYSGSAKNKISGYDITVKNIEGLYKIRLGSFATKEEAINILNMAKNAGFGDSFVVELTYIKQENK